MGLRVHYQEFSEEIEMAESCLRDAHHPCSQGNANHTALTFHLILVRMAKVNKTTNNKCYRENVAMSLIHDWWDYKLAQPL